MVCNISLQAVPLSARKASGGFTEGIAPFLQLPHFSEAVVKKIARKVLVSIIDHAILMGPSGITFVFLGLCLFYLFFSFCSSLK